MLDLQKKVSNAWELKKQGKLIEALRVYDEVYSALMQEALDYAHARGGVIDSGTTRTILPKNFELVREYLRQGEDVAKIINNMGTICAELGDYKKAEQYFKEAISFIPDKSNYRDPYLGLEEIRKLKNG